MIYIVSGYMRTGTSMMMKALSAGGLKPAFDPQRDKMNKNYGDKEYKPNPGGFYEMSRQEYRTYGFPKKYDGKLLKCLWGGLTRFPVMDYMVVFMMRDKEEIRQSYEAFFDGQAPASLENYDERMQDSIAMLKNRKDTKVIIFNYRDVIKNPLQKFTELKENGWPIDPLKAAKIVNPELYRFKLEELTAGI